MTLGNCVLMVGVLMLAFERPGASLAVVALGLVPYVILMVGQRSLLVAALVTLAYIGAGVALMMSFVPFNGDPTNLLLVLVLPAVVIFSWGSAMDSF